MAEEDSAVEEQRSKMERVLREFGVLIDMIGRKAKDISSQTGGLGNLDTMLGRITTGLVGTAGVAAGIYTVVRSLDRLAVSSLTMESFARNTGVASGSVKEMQQAMRRMGMEVNESNAIIGSIGEKLNNMAIFQNGSELWQTLSKFPGAGGEVANSLMAMATQGLAAGDQMKTIQRVMDLINAQTAPESKRALADAFGIPLSVAEKFNAAMARNIRQLSLSREEAQRYHDQWVDIEVGFDNIWKKIGSHGINAVTELTKTLQAEGITTKSVVDWINADTDATMAKIKATVDELKVIRESLDKMKNADNNDPAKAAAGKEGARTLFGSQPFGPLGNFLNLTPYELFSGRRFEYPQADDPMGTDYQRRQFRSKEYWERMYPPRSGTSGATDFSGRRRTVADSWLLAAIPGSGLASMMKEDSQPGPDQHAMRSTLRRVFGIQDPGEPAPWSKGATDFSSRGRADDMVDAQEETSKTLIDIRDILQRMETGEGGGDSTPTFGRGIRGGNTQGSLGGFRKYRGGGSGGLSSADDGVGAGLAGSDFVKARRERFAKEIENNPALRTELAAMMATEGNPTESLESLMNRQDYSGRTLKAGLTPAFYGPMRTGKYQSALAGLQNNPQAMARYNAIIDRVLAGSNIIGGRTDQGMPSDPNGMWGYGTPVWMKRGGNVFTDWGGGPGGHAGAARYRQMIERGVAGEIARKKMDEEQNAKWSGGINAKVEFLNVPPGVRTSAERVGDAFHELQISRTRQGGVYGQQGSTWGYE